MDEQSHHIDDLFQTAVQSHAELPSPEVWEQLERNLQKKNVTSITKKYKKWRWLAGILLVFVVGLGIYTLQLNWKYKNFVNEVVPNTSDLPARNNSVAGKGSLRSPYAQKPGDNFMAGKTKKPELINNDREAGKPPANSSDDANKKTIIAKELTPSRTNTLTMKTKENNINKKRKSQSLRSLAYDQSKTVAIQASKNTRVGNKISDMRKASNPNALGLNRLQEPENIMTRDKPDKAIDSNAELPSHMNSVDRLPVQTETDLRASLILDPLQLLIDKPAVVPYPDVNFSIAKSSIRLRIKSRHPEKYTAGIFYSRNVVATDLAFNRPDFREDNYLQIKSHEKNRVSNIMGLSITRNIVRNLGITSGITLSTYITDITRKPLVARRDGSGKINYRISTSAGYAYYSVRNRPTPALADSIQTLSSKSTVKYLTVPIGLQYSIYFSRFVVRPFVAINANFKTMGKINTIQSLERSYSGNIEGLKSSYYDGSLGLGIGYFLNKKIVISLIPLTRLALSPATENNPVIARRNSSGLAAGLHFHF